MEGHFTEQYTVQQARVKTLTHNIWSIKIVTFAGTPGSDSFNVGSVSWYKINDFQHYSKGFKSSIENLSVQSNEHTVQVPASDGSFIPEPPSTISFCAETPFSPGARPSQPSLLSLQSQENRCEKGIEGHFTGLCFHPGFSTNTVFYSSKESPVSLDLVCLASPSTKIS